MPSPINKILINRATLHTMIPMSERTVYNMEKRGEFPRRIALTSRYVAWDLAEVQEWLKARESAKAKRPGMAA